MKRIGIKRGDEKRRKFVYDDNVALMSSPPQYEVEYFDPKLGKSYIKCSDVEDVTENIRYAQDSCEDVFEYRIFDYHHRSDNTLDNILNQFGEMGFEMCGFDIYRENDQSNNMRLFAIFKRKVKK